VGIGMLVRLILMQFNFDAIYLDEIINRVCEIKILRVARSLDGK
jgi:hypothetical protein